MPRISYLDKSRNGLDDTETTVAQIEEKVAEITALLKGLVDEDNLLQYSDDTTPINIPPSNVLDMPLETRPLEHCMKFFGNLSQEDSIIDKLWSPLNEKIKSNPNFVTVGGIEDGEIQHSVTFEASSDNEGAYIKQDYKSKITEVPTYYVPMTWKELYEYVSNANAYCNVTWDSDGYPSVDSTFASEADFIEQMHSYNREGYVDQLWFNKDIDISTNSDGFSLMLLENVVVTDPSFNEGSNTMEWSSTITPKSVLQTEGYCNLRLLRDNLFKVLL